MAKRPDISVILLTGGQAVRADFAKSSSTPITMVSESVDAEATLVDSVSMVVDAQPRLASRVLVLSTDVWSQLISLPRLSIGGIERDELEAALRFEAETLSGIEIDEIGLAYRPIGSVGDFDQFWVNVLRKPELESVNALLENKGCREIALSHPVGFYSSALEKLDGLAIELWGELAYLLSHNGTQLSKTKQASEEVVVGAARVVVGSNSIRGVAPTIEDWIDLADPESLERWLAHVAQNYGERYEQIAAPVLRKSKPRRGTPVRHLVSGLLAAVVLGFCLWHHNYMNQSIDELQARIETLKQPAADKKLYDAQIIAILEDRANIEAENDELQEELEQIQFFLNNQNNRIAKLLELLKRLRKPDLFIDRIDGTEAGLSISGVSLNGESAQALAKQLRVEAQPLGWMVNPAKQKGLEKLTTGGPWNFSILLTDIGPPENSGG